MEKNDVLIGTAEGLGTSGEGIVKADGFTVFVPFLLPEERAEIKILQAKKGIAYGKVLKLHTSAGERVSPVCPVFTRCGGCQLQHLGYPFQLNFKTRIVEDALRKIGGLEIKAESCVPSEREYGYRNKLQLPVGRRNGENAVGFYAERSHRIVPTDCCPIHPKWSGELISALKHFMEACGLNGYDEETGEGEIRHIVVREVNGKYLITLVTAVKEISGIESLLTLLDAIFGQYSFFLNYHPERTNVIFGKEFRLIKGEGVYEGEESGIVYEAGASTFLQVNEGVRNKLYEAAVSLVKEGEVVVDCYAGGGLLTAMFAKKCGRAYGIEIVPEAHACAESLRKKNGLEGKMTNLLGDTAEKLPKLMRELNGKAIVVLDPPRSGVDRKVIHALKESAPERILMISCNPATLARDLGLLCGTLKENERGELIKTEAEGSYKIDLVRPFDMFPQTRHVETLVCLTRARSA